MCTCIWGAYWGAILVVLACCEDIQGYFYLYAHVVRICAVLIICACGGFFWGAVLIIRRHGEYIREWQF